MSRTLTTSLYTHSKEPQALFKGQETRVSRRNHSGTWNRGTGFSSLGCTSLMRRYDIKLPSCSVSLGSWRSYEKYSWGTHVANADKGSHAIVWREVRNQMSPVPYHRISHWSPPSNVWANPRLSPDPMHPGTRGLKGRPDNIRK